MKKERPMEQAPKKQSSTMKIAVTLGAVIIAVVATTLVQQLLFGKNHIAVTVAVAVIIAMSLTRQLWFAAR